MQNLKDLKNTYKTMKSKGEYERTQFLDGIVEYCKYLGWDCEKTMVMLALVRNFLPVPGQKFTECSFKDEFDIEYNRKLENMMSEGGYKK